VDHRAIPPSDLLPLERPEELVNGHVSDLLVIEFHRMRDA